ncbi:MAG: hypothetical protein COT89_01645 [Candidatus Colwellbacteria bacterium CG10_big_fil_rev_8_21_14_0_10_42_22]|uniref:DUF4870 domain-containing protein n=1 Tax=Candidatus Colwellbacteria bacterium CG10_big_fil_rev_8_21_14_0_10_42_22 TaxID=1974540 RepID=A0A2H0VFQ3_9BACT|nr:MAG: hypothetical protein COT89_01645 [Candidatus Colwellbacteria bacterium CG10_big_fil_rev_8_21_14_0_10_42_22]
MEKLSTNQKIWAGVAYIIFFLPILISGVKSDAFVRFHVRQGFGLFISSFVLKFLSMFFILPLLILIGLFTVLLPLAINIFILVLLIKGIMSALRGEKDLLPVIGDWADKKLKI